MAVAAQVTGSTGAALLPVRGHLPNIPISQSVGELFEAYFRDGWYQTDPRYAGIPALIRRGVMSDFDVGPPEEFVRTPIYRELCAPLGLRWVAGVKVAAGDDLWCLAIQRSADEGPFDPQDMRRLSALSRTLSAAAATARAFGFARAEAALDAFEMSGSAVVLFDRCGQVFRLNRAAECLPAMIFRSSAAGSCRAIRLRRQRWTVQCMLSSGAPMVRRFSRQWSCAARKDSRFSLMPPGCRESRPIASRRVRSLRYWLIWKRASGWSNGIS